MLKSAVGSGFSMFHYLPQQHQGQTSNFSCSLQGHKARGWYVYKGCPESIHPF